MDRQTLKRLLKKKLGPGMEWPLRGGAGSSGRALQSAVTSLAWAQESFSGRGAGLPGQSFDGLILRISPLYRRSRSLYEKQGGRFESSFVSSPRTLGSPILVEQRIEYSPIERELVWTARETAGRRGQADLLRLRTYASSLFHEQNHRILWKLLPPPPPSGPALARFQNFAESLVIGADMALGDDLGPRVATAFYLVGSTYDPGTTLREEGLSRREYRNYLQAAIYATYLHLELYDPARIPLAIRSLFPRLGKLADRAARRAGNLDREFIVRTNIAWQRKFSGLLARRLAHPRGGGRRRQEPLTLSGNPLDSRLNYLWTERFLDHLGI